MRKRERMSRGKKGGIPRRRDAACVSIGRGSAPELKRGAKGWKMAVEMAIMTRVGYPRWFLLPNWSTRCCSVIPHSGRNLSRWRYLPWFPSGFARFEDPLSAMGKRKLGRGKAPSCEAESKAMKEGLLEMDKSVLSVFCMSISYVHTEFNYLKFFTTAK